MAALCLFCCRSLGMWASSAGRMCLGLQPRILAATSCAPAPQFFGPFLGGMVMGGLQEMMEHLSRGGAIMGPAGNLPDQEGEEEDEQEAYSGTAGFGAPAPFQQPPMAKRGGRGGGEGADDHDWGSPQAAQAVKQLRGMGAQVYPPGASHTVLEL